jgi:hypothetical protein
MDSDDDGFWRDVVAAFQDCVREGMTLGEDELWEFAKVRARYRHVLQTAHDQANREGKDFLDIMTEEHARRKRQDIN